MLVQIVKCKMPDYLWYSDMIGSVVQVSPLLKQDGIHGLRYHVVDSNNVDTGKKVFVEDVGIVHTIFEKGIHTYHDLEGNMLITKYDGKKFEHIQLSKGHLQPLAVRILTEYV